MKVRIQYKAKQMAVDRTFTGSTADDVVRQMQKEVASHLNFLMRPFVLGMSPTAFGQEAVSRYNEATGKSVPKPQSADEFLTLGEREGIVTFLER